MHRSWYSNVFSALTLSLALGGSLVDAQPRRANRPLPLIFEAGIGPGFWFKGEPVSFELAVLGGVEFLLTERLAVRALLPLELSTSGREDEGIPINTLALAPVPRVQAAVQLVRDLAFRIAAGVGPAYFRHTITVPPLGNRTFATTVLNIDLSTGMEYLLHERVAVFFDPIRMRIFSGGERREEEFGNVRVTQTGGTSLAWTMLLGAAVRL